MAEHTIHIRTERLATILISLLQLQPDECTWPLTFPGFVIAPIGDLDQNGAQDDVVTDPMDGGVMQQSNPTGAAYVVLKNAHGTVLKSVSIANKHNGGPALNSDDVL